MGIEMRDRSVSEILHLVVQHADATDAKLAILDQGVRGMAAALGIDMQTAEEKQAAADAEKARLARIDAINAELAALTQAGKDVVPVPSQTRPQQGVNDFQNWQTSQGRGPTPVAAPNAAPSMADFQAFLASRGQQLDNSRPAPVANPPAFPTAPAPAQQGTVLVPGPEVGTGPTLSFDQYQAYLRSQQQAGLPGGLPQVNTGSIQ